MTERKDIVERATTNPSASPEVVEAIKSQVRADLIEIEALCHMETRQKLLSICRRAIERIDAALGKPA